MRNDLKFFLKLMAVSFAMFLCLVFGCNTHKQPVNVEYFKQGQILLPDYACSDTLIVIDAEGLNKSMGLIEQGIIDATDGDIDSVFHQYCKVK